MNKKKLQGKSEPLKINCPHCDKPLEWTPKNKHRPFCSKRCQLYDLQAWAEEEHSISGDSTFDDLMSEELDAPPPIH